MSLTNLDISNVESDDIDALASKIETFYKADTSVKTRLAWNWERNHLMLDGKQWIQFESNQATGSIWRPLRISKQNEYIPRPVTNYLFDIYQTLKSYLIKNKPRSQVTPNTTNYEDRMSAKVATLILEANWERLKEANNYEYAAANALTYGTVFKKSFWDTSTVNMVDVPRMQTVPQIDPQTGAVIGQQEIPVTDPVTGDPVIDQIPIGDVNTTIVEPFLMAIDPLAPDLHKAEWIMEYSIKRLSWIQDVYGKDPQTNPGYTGLAGEVKEERTLNNTLMRFFQLKTSSGVRNNLTTTADTSQSGDSMIENAAVVKEYWEKPTPKYPKGRLIVVANGVTLYASDSPYSGEEQGDWHPYSEFRWEIAPGRFWGKSPLDDVVELQKRLNSIDSVQILTRKTSAIPQKLIPIGVGITPGMWTGRPNQEIFYKDNGTGAKPEIIPPSANDPAVAAERAQTVEDMKSISGAIDILKGDNPPGVNAASALSLLYEVGTGKLFPSLDRWKAFVENDQKKQLKIIQKFYKEPRPEFIKHLRMLNRELPEASINSFIGEDLRDNCNVVVEAGSNVPKLQAAHQARLMEMAQIGVLKLELPANRMQFLQDMGISGYDNDVGPDVKRAEWENTLLDSILLHPDKRPIVFDADDHDTHIAIHQKRQKEPSFMELPSEAQQAYIAHVQEHEQFKQKKMQAELLQQQAMAPAPGTPVSAQPSAPQGPSEGIHPAGKGLNKEMKAQVFGTDLKSPANIG